MKSFVAFAPLVAIAACQSTSTCGPKPSGSIAPSVASGYKVQVVATGLAAPRGIQLDSKGNLLVVQQSEGVITALTLNESNGCVLESSRRNVTSDLALNHGIALSGDGNTLYGSSTASAWSWNYNATSQTVSNQSLLISNMTTSDHTTRTLLLSQKAPGLLLVTRGSTANIDFAASSLSSGHSQVKAFDLNNMTAGQVYDFDTDGLRLAWGVRNEVGIAEHPISGGVFGVENSADDLTRMSVNIHQNNPAEEMNFFGYLNGTNYADQGQNFGYPWCFTAWNVSELPDNGNITVGTQFAIDASSASNNQNKTDAFCATQVAPRLAFQAHMAPLDIVFNNSGSEAWITFHGSWDRTEPVGYKVSFVSFNGQTGEPTEPSTSMTAAMDIFSNTDNSACPSDCFRPAGLAIDGQGRIFVSSDASGEIYLITRDQGAPASVSPAPSSTSNPTATSTGTESSSTATHASSAGSMVLPPSSVVEWLFGLLMACWLFV